MQIKMQPVPDSQKHELVAMIKKKYPWALHPEYWLILHCGNDGLPMWSLPSSYFENEAEDD